MYVHRSLWQLHYINWIFKWVSERVFNCVQKELVINMVIMLPHVMLGLSSAGKLTNNAHYFAQTHLSFQSLLSDHQRVRLWIVIRPHYGARLGVPEHQCALPCPWFHSRQMTWGEDVDGDGELGKHPEVEIFADFHSMESTSSDSREHAGAPICTCQEV